MLVSPTLSLSLIRMNLQRQVSQGIVLQAGEDAVLAAAGVTLSQVDDFCEDNGAVAPKTVTLQAAIDGARARKAAK